MFLAIDCLALEGGTSQDTRHNPTLPSFCCLTTFFAPGVVQVHRARLDLGVKGILVEQDCAPTIMTDMKSFRDFAAVDVISCLMSVMMCHLPAICLTKGVCVSSPRSWIPIVDAESYLLFRLGGVTPVRLKILRRGIRLSFSGLSKSRQCVRRINHV